ncbi:hypothetical protein QL093DRAFT_1052188 [Fusarium oxysporum]|nr:hypothetical protein QL093DRAFT_1052188 [Fusarium oxysporum]
MYYVWTGPSLSRPSVEIHREIALNFDFSPVLSWAGLVWSGLVCFALYIHTAVATASVRYLYVRELQLYLIQGWDTRHLEPIKHTIVYVRIQYWNSQGLVSCCRIGGADECTSGFRSYPCQSSA